jgi:hypothetical protein
MEPEGSLQFSQQPDTGPYPESDVSSFEAHHYAVFSTFRPLSPNIFFRTLFSYTRNQFLSINLRDQISHPYKTTTITVLIF